MIQPINRGVVGLARKVYCKDKNNMDMTSLTFINILGLHDFSQIKKLQGTS